MSRVQHGAGEAVGRVVGDFDGVGFVFERNHGSDGAKDFLAGDARGVVHVIENRGFHVVALAEALGASTADGGLGFLLSHFKIGSDAVVLFLADQRAHLWYRDRAAGRSLMRLAFSVMASTNFE